MDEVLLAFPPDGEVSDRLYHDAIGNHINRVESLFSREREGVLGAANQLLEVQLQ